MKKIVIAAAMVVAILATSLPTQAQTTSSENNAANTAQSQSGNVKDRTTDAGKSRAGVSRRVTGSRPDSNSTSNRVGSSTRQQMREKRAPSTADGKVSTKRRVRADAKTKKERGNGRSFGNTGSENQ